MNLCFLEVKQIIQYGCLRNLDVCRGHTRQIRFRWIKYVFSFKKENIESSSEILRLPCNNQILWNSFCAFLCYVKTRNSAKYRCIYKNHRCVKISGEIYRYTVKINIFYFHNYVVTTKFPNLLNFYLLCLPSIVWTLDYMIPWVW